MLGKIKKALGIEGVKVTLVLDEKDSVQEHSVSGMARFTTKSDSKVRSFKLSLTERFSRGRGDKRLTDEYVLGSYEHTTSFTIKKEEIIEIPFVLQYGRMQSEMDRLENRNFVFRGIVSLAKKLKRVRSTFELVIEANVVGTKLDPYDKQILDLE